MKLTVTEPTSGCTRLLETDDDISVDTLRALVAVDFQIDPERQQLFVNSRLLSAAENEKLLREVPLRDGDVIVLVDSVAAGDKMKDIVSSSQRNSSVGSAGNNAAAANSLNFPSMSAAESAQVEREVNQDVDHLLQRLQTEPLLPEALRATHPAIAEALGQRDRSRLVVAVKADAEKQRAAHAEQRRRWMFAMANPLLPESQKLMLERIEQEGIEEAYQHAQEYLPESFGNVFMLYVKIEVNKIKLKAFVDSGAQSTLMSKRCAERCNLMRLIDTRFAGIAQGIGTSKIVGRIHVVQIKMGNQFFAASITVLEDDKVDFLFGLDLLRRHQCVVDLKANVLRIGSEELHFLSEQETKGDIFSPSSFGESSPARSSIPVSTGAQPVSDATRIAVIESTEPRTPAFRDYGPIAAEDRIRNAGRHAIDEEKIKRLTEFGFSRPSVIHALETATWNIDVAAGLLFQEADPLRNSNSNR